VNPVRALEEQRLLMARLSQPQYASYMTSYQSSVESKNAGPVISNRRGNPDGGLFCQSEIARLTMADAYYVSRDMVPLVQWASKSLNDIDRFDRTLWPSDYGFVWFEEPIQSIEARGRTTSHVAMSWGRRAGELPNGDEVAGTFCVFYTDINGTDELNTEIRAEAAKRNNGKGNIDDLLTLGRLHVAHLLWIADEQRVGPSELSPAENPESYDAHKAFRQVFMDDPTNRSLVDAAPNISRFVLSMLMMLNQTVTEVSDFEVDTRTARRMKHMGLPSKVTIVRLRRTKGMERLEGETLVEWANRWLVKGHWRNQPYKNDDGTTRYERIWIAPYVKGPEDKPFKQSDKVYALLR
jgi:hypothetical protein